MSRTGESARHPSPVTGPAAQSLRHTRTDGGRRVQSRSAGGDGRGRLDHPRRARRARFPRLRGGAVRLAALRRAGAGMERLGAGVPGAERGDDPGARRGPLLGGRRGQLRVGAEAGRGRRGRRRQHQPLAHARRRSSGRRRGQPRCRRGPRRHRRQPELLDHADGRRAQAPLRRGRDRAPGHLHLPGGVGHRQGGDRRAAGPVQGGAQRPRRGRQRLSAPDRVQRAAAGGQLRGRRRPHRRGAQADRRDAKDSRRRVDPGQRDMRAGACCDRPLGGRQRRDEGAALAGASP